MGTPTRSTFALPKPTITDTPVKSKATRTAPAIAHGLEEGRKAVMSDLGFAIPAVTVDYFKNALLPPLRQGLSVDNIITRLQEDGHLDDKKRWTELFVERPSNARSIENKVFQDFERMATEVLRAAGKALAAWAAVLPNRNKQDIRPTTVFQCNPDMKPEFQSRLTTSKSDSFAHLFRGAAFSLPHTLQRSVLWDDIVVPGEFKQSLAEQDIVDNNRKLMWSMNHVMWESVRRRFVFGYTIEDVYMRLWFLSRSDALVTIEFDFLEDCHTLVHFLLSIMFASPQDLGFDPTMRRIGTVGKVQATPGEGAAPRYDIAVCLSPKEKRWYRTQRLLSNVGAEAARGRGTRVWEVVRLNEHDEPVGGPRVLKDCWVDHYRTREGDILQQIRDSAKTEEHRSSFKDYLLTVECHGDVYIGEQKDETHTLIRRGRAIPESTPWYRLQAAAPAASADRSSYSSDFFIRYDDKSHYRIVFEELGTSIDKLNSAFDISLNCCLVLEGLQALHQCGWVHRDISMGNILVVRDHDTSLPKIADVEHAQRVGDNSEIHQAPTGTECFMPVEIQSRRYQFLPPQPQVGEKPQAVEQDCPAVDEEAVSAHLQKRKWIKPPLRRLAKPVAVDVAVSQPAPKYNPIHDLEGFWWTSLILTLYRKIHGANQARPQSLLKFMQKIFINSWSRMSVITDSGYFKIGIADLDTDLKVAADKLEEARSLLVGAFEAAEMDIPNINHTAADSIYPAFQKAYLGIVEDLVSVGDFDFEPLGATFIKPQAEAAIAFASLSLDSRKAQLGKRTREEFSGDRNLCPSGGRTRPSPPAKRTKCGDVPASYIASGGDHSMQEIVEADQTEQTEAGTLFVNLDGSTEKDD